MIQKYFLFFYLFAVFALKETLCQCNTGWFKNTDPSIKSCYQVFYSHVNKNAAQLACSSMNSFLSNIESQAEWDYITGFKICS
jgi:hypothetical protein